jgi:chitodextrinase
VLRNGVVIATVTGLSYTDTGLTELTTYGYQIQAVDAAGNVSVLGAAVQATTPQSPDVMAPTVPTGVSATALGVSSVQISWQASADNRGVVGYSVYRAGSLIATVTDGLSYTDTGLASSTAYSYTVTAYDAAGNEGSAGVEAIATTQTPPDVTAPTKPTNFKLTLNTTNITLNWTGSTDNVGVVGYVIGRNGVKIATVTTLSYVDTAVVQGTAYSYSVYAIDAAGNQSSHTVLLTMTFPDTTAPSAPTGLTAVVGATGSKSIKLTWNAATDNVTVTGYRIYRGTMLIATVSGTTLTYTDTGLTSGTTYSYTVVAIDAAGNQSVATAPVTGKAK